MEEENKLVIRQEDGALKIYAADNPYGVTAGQDGKIRAMSKSEYEELCKRLQTSVVNFKTSPSNTILRSIAKDRLAVWTVKGESE